MPKKATSGIKGCERVCNLNYIKKACSKNGPLWHKLGNLGRKKGRYGKKWVTYAQIVSSNDEFCSKGPTL